MSDHKKEFDAAAQSALSEAAVLIRAENPNAQIKGAETEEKLDEWRKKYGEVYEFIVPMPTEKDPNALGVAYLRKPKFDDFLEFVTESNPLMRGMLIFNRCKLGGVADELDREDTPADLRTAAYLRALSLESIPVVGLKKSSKSTASPATSPSLSHPNNADPAPASE